MHDAHNVKRAIHMSTPPSLSVNLGISFYMTLAFPGSISSARFLSPGKRLLDLLTPENCGKPWYKWIDCGRLRALQSGWVQFFSELSMFWGWYYFGAAPPHVECYMIPFKRHDYYVLIIRSTTTRLYSLRNMKTNMPCWGLTSRLYSRHVLLGPTTNPLVRTLGARWADRMTVSVQSKLKFGLSLFGSVDKVLHKKKT